MATAQAAKNGVEKKPTTRKKTVSETVKTPTENPVIQLADEGLKKMVTFQQTVERLNELQRMADDYTKVTETLKSISDFKGGSNESIQFALQDFTNDTQFLTYNSNLIAMVVDILTAKLQEKQADLMDKILAFKL